MAFSREFWDRVSEGQMREALSRIPLPVHHRDFHFDLKTLEEARKMNDPFEKDWKGDGPTVLMSQGPGLPAKEVPIAEVSANWHDTPVAVGGPPGSDCEASLTGTGYTAVLGSPKLTTPTEACPRCGHRDGRELHCCEVPQEKRVDPMWDRYFEMAFKSLMDKWNISERGVATKAADYADAMMAERSKRAKR